MYRIIKLKESNKEYAGAACLSNVAEWMNRHNFMTDYLIEDKYLERLVEDNLLVLEIQDKAIEEIKYGFTYKEVKISEVLEQRVEPKWQLNRKYVPSRHLKFSIIKRIPRGKSAYGQQVAYGSIETIIDYLNDNNETISIEDFDEKGEYCLIHGEQPIIVSDLLDYNEAVVVWAVRSS